MCPLCCTALFRNMRKLPVTDYNTVMTIQYTVTECITIITRHCVVGYMGGEAR